MKLSEIDRGIYNAIRTKLVEAGYYVNISLYNNSAALIAAEDALRASLAATDNTLIRLEGVGHKSDKGEKKDARILIIRTGFEDGNIGGFPVTKYVQTGGTAGTANAVFKKIQLPDKSDDIEYEIRYICTSVKVERLIIEVLMNALGRRAYLTGMTGELVSNEETFYIERTGSSPISTDDFIEHMFKYMVRDVWITDEKTLATGIPAMQGTTGSTVEPKDDINE